MFTIPDILAYIVHECLFNCPRFYVADCFYDSCNLCFHIYYDMIIDGKY